MRVVTHVDRADLVEQTAGRLADLIGEFVAARGRATIALTGGSVGIELLAALNGRDIDWERVFITWSDERFVPDDSADRNALQARQALLDHVPVPDVNVLELPASDGTPLEDAAIAATELLRGFGPIDLTLLGMGPDAHVASLFPGLLDLHEPGIRVIPVRHSPKPPPERLSFTLEAINASDRVWLIVAGADKAEAVALTRRGAPADEAPAAAVRGRLETLMLLDEVAAGQASA